jgi:secreted trypsin-like serine protease
MIPLYLRTVDLPSVSDTECELRYWPLRSRRYFLCAGYLEEYLLRGVCMGDSGSPLIQRGEDGRSVQVGIVSGGRLPCGSGSFPGTYARVSAFRQWIKTVAGT